MVLGVVLILLLSVACILAGPILWTRTVARRVEQMVPQAGQSLPVSGGAIHFVDLGPKDAPPVLMIHGLSGQMQHFTYALAAQLSEDTRLIIVDRPGCGYSTRDGVDQADLLKQGRMILEVLDHLKIPEATVVGHSLGGAVALGIALDHPDRVSGLALIAPLTHRPAAPSSAFAGLAVQSQLKRKIIGHTLAVPMGQLNGEAIVAEVFRPDPVAPSFATRAGAALGLRPKSFITASQDFNASAGIKEMSSRYSDLKTPGIVLYGEQDVILSAKEQGVPMAQYGLAYRELPDRGHMLPMTAVEDCTRLVRDVIALARS